MRQIRIASGIAAINPPKTPRRKLGKVLRRKRTVPESTISTSRKVTVSQVTSNLNSDSAISPSDERQRQHGRHQRPPQDREKEQIEPDPGQDAESEMEDLEFGGEQRRERRDMDQRDRAEARCVAQCRGRKAPRSGLGRGKTRNRHGRVMPCPVGFFVSVDTGLVSSNCNKPVMTRSSMRGKARKHGISEWGLMLTQRASLLGRGQFCWPGLALFGPSLGHVDSRRPR